MWVLGCASLLVCLSQRPEQPVLSKDSWGMVLGKEPSLNPKDGRKGGEALPFLCCWGQSEGNVYNLFQSGLLPPPYFSDFHLANLRNKSLLKSYVHCLWRPGG